MRTLLVLAAGMGSRYGGLKQLDAVGPHGETIMDYSIYDAKRAGFDKVVFVIRRAIEEAFTAQIGRRYAGILPVAYAFQELDSLPRGFAPPPERTKPWGTGHAILVARSAIDTPFAVINADDFYGADGYRAVADRLARSPDDGCMVGYRIGKTLSAHGRVSRGVCRCTDEGFLASIVETHGIEEVGGTIRASDGRGGYVALTGTELVSMNLWGFPPSIFDRIETWFTEFLQAHSREPNAEFYIPSFVNRMIEENRRAIAVLQCEAEWFGVTYREDKPHVERRIRELVEQGVYPSPLWG